MRAGKSGTMFGWRQLVADACRGIHRDGDEVDSICDFAGKTTDDLAKAIQHFQSRESWKADLQAGEIASGELHALGGELTADAAENQRRIAELNAACAARQTDRRNAMARLEVVINRSHESRVRLNESLAPEFVAKIEAIQAETKALLTELQDIRETARLKIRWGRMPTIFYNQSKSQEGKVEAAIAALNAKIQAIELEGVSL